MKLIRWPAHRGYHSASNVLLLRSGQSFFDRLVTRIHLSKSTIFLQTYVLLADDTGQQVIDALKEAAQRGIEIWLTIDAYGSSDLPETTIEEMKRCGIHIHLFEPILDFNNLSIGRRLHHKIAVFDSTYAIVGGINLSNNYNDIGPNPAWLDFAVELKGTIAQALEERAKQIRFRKDALPLSKGQPKTELPGNVFPVKMIINDWLRGYGEIIRSYRQAVRQAQKEIIISGSYFLPSRRLLKLLKAASKRGVAVKIILTQESDVLLATRATRHLYRQMFKYGLQIFEWKHSVLHAKTTVIDSEWVTIGSFNLNFLSAFESVELNLEIVDTSFATSFRSTLDEIMKNDCATISPLDFEKKYTFIHRITDWVAYQLLRYTMRFPLLFAKRLTKPFDAYGSRTYHTD